MIFKDTLHSGDEGELITRESWHVPVLLGLAGAFEGLSVQQEGEEGVLPLALNTTRPGVQVRQPFQSTSFRRVEVRPSPDLVPTCPKPDAYNIWK